MRKGAKSAIIVSAIVLAIATLALLLYFVVFDTFTIVSDPSLQQVLPSSTVAKARMDFLSKGVRLKVKTLDEVSFHDSSSFVSAMSRTRGKYVLLGPLSSAFAVKNQVDVSSLLPDSFVLGFDAEDGVLFDCNLTSNEDSGWRKAATAIAKETASMSQNVGLVFDNEYDSHQETIVSCFGKNRLSLFEKEGSSRLFVSGTIDEMNSQGIVLALCPHVDGFSSFFASWAGNVSWVVDYRFALVVPKANLYGVVVPDLSSVLHVVRTASKGQRTSAELEYSYEKR